MPRKKTTRKAGETRGRKPAEKVLLSTQHSINGVKYGPGQVQVPADVAQVLREQERRFKDSERFLRSQGAHLVGAGGRIVHVKPEFFHQALGQFNSGF